MHEPATSTLTREAILEVPTISKASPAVFKSRWPPVKTQYLVEGLFEEGAI